ncbi:antitoxin [Actinomadura rugatobispora]|uniref:Antitoxin n=1 Tax=Actinomadura rugatobispora TaxID=1994 RepID=A0ABW1ABG7_9ACTN|nr:hypothetical protein GCM10010200_070180 [Actinomadura rugatobispora]
MSIVDKMKEMLGQHGDKAKKGMEKGGDVLDQKTGGKHTDKIDQAQQKAGDYIDRSGQGDAPQGGQQPGERPGEGTPGT